jgi:hypothetical protein
MTSALTSPDARLSIEDARTDWRQTDASEFSRRHDWKRVQAQRTWALYLRWCAETGHVSRLEYARWLTGEAAPATQLYVTLNAGRALAAGLDYGCGVSDLSYLGRALDTLTAPEIDAMPEAQRVTHCRDLVVQARTEGTVSVPVSERAAVSAFTQRVSDSERLAQPEATALVIRAFEALPETMQQAAIQSQRTGQPLQDAARVIVAQALDPRRWLSQRPCFVPNCGMPSEELHHLKLTGTRFRSQEVLAPLCRRHHQAQMGQQSAHANHQQDWIAQHWPSEAAFWESLSALYAERLFGADTLNTLEENA